MKFTIEMLKDKLPTNVYEALRLDKADHLLKATMEEINKARKVLDCAPPAHFVPISYRKFTADEIRIVDSCMVVAGNYGMLVQFNIKEGEPKYIPAANQDCWTIGQELDIDDIKLMTLQRGDDIIHRVVPIDAEEKTYFASKKVTPEEAAFRNKLYSKLFCMLREIKFEVRDGALNVFSFVRLY